MTFCKKCGKELPEGVACDCENTQTPVVSSTPFVVPSSGDISANENAPVMSPAGNDDNDGEYLAVTKNCKIINIIAIILFAGGIVSLLLINGWVAAIMFFVAEILVLMPNTKLQMLCKAKNPSADKKAQQKAVKETTKRLKSKDKNFNFSFIIAVICLVSLIASFIVPSPLLKNKQNTNTYVPEETTTEVAEPLCYRPTVEEFMEDFAYMHKELLVNDITYRIEQSEDNDIWFSVYVATNGIDYMNIDCAISDGSIIRVMSYINDEAPICEIWGSEPRDDATEFIGFAENILVAYVLLNYQNPEEYPCDTEAFGDFVKLMTSAVKSGEGNSMHQSCSREYENCSIDLSYSSMYGTYKGNCDLPRD